jgi:hypothetical protein
LRDGTHPDMPRWVRSGSACCGGGSGLSVRDRSVAVMTMARQVVADYWAAAEARDWARFGKLVAEDGCTRVRRPGSGSAAGRRKCGSTSRDFPATGT